MIPELQPGSQQKLMRRAQVSTTMNVYGNTLMGAKPSLGLCDRLNRTRDNSQRQLPTDHDYAVPTREYQTDQSSLKTAPTDESPRRMIPW
jgi:hypothetical protein